MKIVMLINALCPRFMRQLFAGWSGARPERNNFRRRCYNYISAHLLQPA